MTYTLTAHDRRCVAVAAVVDPRTVERYLRGEPIKSTTHARITAALASWQAEPERRQPKLFAEAETTRETP